MVMTMRIPEPSAAISIPWSARAFRRGLLAALPFILSNGAAGVAMGIAYRGLGLDFSTAALFSTAVYSATAQAVTLGLWAVPPPIAAMAIACVATNARYLIMGAHLRQLFPDVPRRAMLPTLFLLADASWLMTAAEAERGRRDAAYLLGSSLPMALGWIGGTALGRALPIDLSGPLASAAAFLPLAFVIALLPSQWRGRRSLLPWAVAAVVSLAVARSLSPNWAMLLGGGAGTLVGLLGNDDV